MRRHCPFTHQSSPLLQTCGPQVGGWNRPSQQFRMGEEGKEWRGGGMSSDSCSLNCGPESHWNNGQWQLMWKYTQFWHGVCEWEREKWESSTLAIETRWSKPHIEWEAQSSSSSKNQVYVSPHTVQEVLCYAVWLWKTGCFQVQKRMRLKPVQACKGFTQLHLWNRGPLTWRP